MWMYKTERSVGCSTDCMFWLTLTSRPQYSGNTLRIAVESWMMDMLRLFSMISDPFGRVGRCKIVLLCDAADMYQAAVCMEWIHCEYVLILEDWSISYTAIGERIWLATKLFIICVLRAGTVSSCSFGVLSLPRYACTVLYIVVCNRNLRYPYICFVLYIFVSVKESSSHWFVFFVFQFTPVNRYKGIQN